jgi:hypothetical protein
VVGHGSPADATFENDRADSHQPVLLTHSYNNLNCDHWMPSRYRNADTLSQVRPHLFCSLRILTVRLVPVDLSQRPWGPGVGARDALSPFLNERCINDMICFILFDDHPVALICNPRGEQRAAVLVHFLGGKRVLAPSSCSLVMRDASSTIKLPHLPCSLLPAANQNKLFSFCAFSPCRRSSGLHAATASPGREL